MKNVLLLLGLIVVLGVLVISFVSIIKRVILSVKEKNYQALTINLVILLIAIAIVIALFK